MIRPLSTGVRNLIKDQLISVAGPDGQRRQLCRVEAWGELDGPWRTMVFLTNHLEGNPATVGDRCRKRREIEVFFKQVQQVLNLGSFLGYHENAVKWQAFTALLVYVLPRFLAYLSPWPHRFKRLFTVIRAALWERFELLKHLHSHGTTAARLRVSESLAAAWPPGLTPCGT